MDTYKKVLLCDRKSHTTRNVASLALLVGRGGTPVLSWGGGTSVLSGSTPVPVGGYPLSWPEYTPPAGPGTGLWTGPVTGLGVCLIPRKDLGPEGAPRKGPETVDQ